jgi:hypothetical protein
LIYLKISVYITNLDISIKNSSARAAFRTVQTSGKTTGSVTDIVPQLLGKYDFNISLKRESDDWKVNSAMWVQAEMVNTWEDDDSYDESG